MNIWCTMFIYTEFVVMTAYGQGFNIKHIHVSSFVFCFQMEQLKRANNIWTNDSLFVREYILIPVSKSPMQETRSIVNGDSSVSSGVDGLSEEIVTKQDLQVGRMSRSSSKAESLTAISENTVPDIKPIDFLSRFDSSLAQIRSSVQKLDESSR